MIQSEENEYEWALQTSAALRAGRLADVNFEDVAEYIHAIASGWQRDCLMRFSKAVVSCLEGDPTNASHEWNHLRDILDRYPTLAEHITQADIEDAYRDAVDIFMVGRDATDQPPFACPYTIPWILANETISAAN